MSSPESRDHLINWDYPEFVDGACKATPVNRPFLGPMGLSGEAGEVSELFKKHLIHGKPLDRDRLIEELGDVMWYFNLILIDQSITLEEVLSANMEKLKKRHAEEPERYVKET